MPAPPAIEARELTVELGGRAVLDRVSLAVAPGEKVVVRGESGSGKSTLLATLVGARRPARGEIRVFGDPLDRFHAPAIRRRTFYMPQEVRPTGEETGREFVDHLFGFAATRAARPSPERLREELAAFALDPRLLDARLATLSGGERQRLALVRGLLLERELMLLDEVTSAVDERGRDRIVERLLGLEGVALVAVSHDPELAARADRVVELTAQGGAP